MTRLLTLFTLVSLLLTSCYSGRIKYSNRKKIDEPVALYQQTEERTHSFKESIRKNPSIEVQDQVMSEAEEAPNSLSKEDETVNRTSSIEQSFEFERDTTSTSKNKKEPKFSPDEVAVRSMKAAKTSIFLMSFFIISLGLALLISLTYLIIAFLRYTKATSTHGLTEVGHNALSIAEKRMGLALLLIILIPIGLAISIYLISLLVGATISLASILVFSSFSLAGLNLSW
jgi:hypothetical protein